MNSPRLQDPLGEIHPVGILLQPKKQLPCGGGAVYKRGAKRLQPCQVVAMNMAQEAH